MSEGEQERRERISAQVREWCERLEIDGRHRELSDEAAVLIAAGQLDDVTRSVLANRRREGKDIPSVGGFAALRRLADERGRLLRRASTARPGPVQAVVKLRCADVERRLLAMHATVVRSQTHYAGSVRAIRRERKLGIHLDLGQREALFAALARTPAPISSNLLAQFRSAALGVAVGRIGGLSETSALGRKAVDSLTGKAGRETDSFVDRYDTLLFLAGSLYDRVEGSAVWQSGHFAVQRAQLDLADELMQIAVDTVALRELLAELSAASHAARLDSARKQIRARQQALAPVWDQLVERVAALARIGDLLSKAEDQLHSMAAVEKTMSLDARIDDLIARSGNRELSAANTHFVGDQFDDVDELLLSYQSLLYADILALTSRR
ncbi:hypothetical protein [Antrihabitans stalactiti]|uniref:Uncharacterized protein n=1 Tax=Antrihabitans stalactiti TaxID=2584121 RepID=A0A848KBB0_9NOCA|nr:hypothetical protein [Antrihabitans stalactiti]NMN94474.1 hypothetical protein [Antrihabitans stalactiti]